MQFKYSNLGEKPMINQEVIITKDQINLEMGLGRTRTEIHHPDPNGHGPHQQTPSIEEEAIFEELGLGKISYPNDLVYQNDNDDCIN